MALFVDECSPAQNIDCAFDGIRDIKLDPHDPDIIYITPNLGGIWRSTDAGLTWAQIRTPFFGARNQSFIRRTQIAVNKLDDGKTRLYAYEGGDDRFDAPSGQLIKTDDAAGEAIFELLTSDDVTSSQYGSFATCSPQCFYDISVTSPMGHPDIVYVGGTSSRFDNLTVQNRNLVMSTDAGQSFHDVSCGAEPTGRLINGISTFNCLHVDHHNLAISQENPYLFFSVHDGGIARSSGEMTDM